MISETKKEAILIGDYTNPQYHPLSPVDQELAAVFNGVIQVQSTEDYEFLRFDRLSWFDLFICYADHWEGTITPEQTAGILSFVANGGGLLVIHTGISFQSSYEYAQLVGARFTGHPPFQNLEYTTSSAAADHPIMRGIGGFSAPDEPYQFEMDPFTKREILFEYQFEGTSKPAAWAHSWGLGRVVYLMPGHDVNPFLNPTYREIIKRSGLWALKMI
ncbi:MAG TPA: ThuA domain-containing protein [Bacillota bacterium]|nr:ThuA domain-containing protein [Bacillota bacterium]